MLETVGEGGSTRRRSTFYVPLTSTDDTPAVTPPSIRSDRGAFSPFRRPQRKPVTPPIQEGISTPRRNAQCMTPKHSSCQQLHQKVERTPVRISHLQQPQKARTLDACQLVKSTSASVPILTESRTQSLEVLNRSKTSAKVPLVVIEQDEQHSDCTSHQPTDEDAGIHSGAWVT